MWPQDVAIALPCPTQNRSAIPHVSPEARARTFMCTHTQPSQLFPKKGSSLQENSSNQLSRKWREVGGGGETSRKDRAQGAAGQGQYIAGTFCCQGAGRPWVSLLRQHPSSVGPLCPLTPKDLRARRLRLTPARLHHGPLPTWLD